MKNGILFLALLLVLISCKNKNSVIVSVSFADSLINHYNAPAVNTNAQEMLFWKNRISATNPDIVNSSKYAGTLISRYHLLGDINDVKRSDSILLQLAKAFNGKEGGPYFSMISHSILQHKFRDAGNYLTLAQTIGLKQYDNAAVCFDVNFELGLIPYASTFLKTMQHENDYGYQFRKSKLMHYYGELDSSIKAMQAAVDLAGNDMSLRQAALSNVGDLYIHAGKLQNAYDCYVECIQMNPADLHSIMGIGWIALVHDNNDTLAEKIFSFVQHKTKSPEPFFKLVQLAEKRGDSVLQKKYATTFEHLVTDTIYGGMYNKFLIQLYTGILDDPAKAVAVAKLELSNRSTSQTYAWNVWALLCNHQKEEAYALYQKNVSGKPLESLELYWMGKLMQSLNKGYNAKQYFEQAEKNIYDLDPAVQSDLKKCLSG